MSYDPTAEPKHFTLDEAPGLSSSDAYYYDESTKLIGRRSLQITETTGTAIKTVLGPFLPAVVDEPYQLSAWMQTDDTNNVCTLDALWYRADKTTLDQSNVNAVVFRATGTWQLSSFLETPSVSTIAYVRPRVRFQAGSAATKTLHLQSVSVRLVPHWGRAYLNTAGDYTPGAGTSEILFDTNEAHGTYNFTSGSTEIVSVSRAGVYAVTTQLIYEEGSTATDLELLLRRYDISSAVIETQRVAKLTTTASKEFILTGATTFRMDFGDRVRPFGVFTASTGQQVKAGSNIKIAEHKSTP